jgi:hypothetical protein
MKLVNRIKINRRVTTSGPSRQGAPVKARKYDNGKDGRGVFAYKEIEG